MQKLTGALGRRVVRTMGLLSLVALAACESATAPDAPTTLDPNLALRDYQAMDNVLGTDALKGFRALGGRVGLAPGNPIDVAARIANVHDDASARELTLQLGRQLTGGVSTKEILSPRHRGMTLVYDAARDTYVVAAGRTGAPANGVRFITYEVDANGKPVPTQESGYADLLDEGATTGDTVVLRLKVVRQSVTHLDYRTRLALAGGTGSITVDGFMTDGTSRLDFDVAVSSRKSGTATLLDADFSLQVKARAFSIQGKARGINEGTGDGTVGLTVRHGESSVAVDMTNSAGTLAGTFQVNGRLLATAAGDAKNPTLTGATGAPLTGAELLMVMHIVDMTDSIFDLVEDLVKPVDNLIVLGWLL